MSTEVTISELRANIGDLIARVQRTGEHITITRRGKPVAALVPVDDLEVLAARERVLE